MVESPCTECSGEGRNVAQRRLEVDIPAGIHDGQRILIRGEGDAGYQGGARGNVFVVVRVRRDPRFVRDGNDLHTGVRLTMTEAALGSTMVLPAPGGEIELEIPPGAQPGDVRTLTRRGMPTLHGPGSGNLYVKIEVAVPTRMNEEQRRLLEDFDRQAGPETYGAGGDEDEGFFRRLKSALR